MPTQRINWIDIAKGLLIWIVVLHHVPDVAEELSLSDPFFEGLANLRYGFIGYFMPAFFIITGYCSRPYEGQGFGKVVVKNLKQIILPGFTLGAIANWISLLSKGIFTPIEYCKLGFTTLATQGGPFWFLTALFMAKVLDCGVSKTLMGGGGGKFLQPFVYLILIIVGILMNEWQVYEPWSLWHACVLCIFLWVGRFLHAHPLSRRGEWAAAGVFVVFTIIWGVCEQRIPHVTFGINVHLTEIADYLLMSTCGTLMVLLVSKAIGSCRLLQFFGQHSLIVYGLHIAVLFALFRPLMPWLGRSLWLSALLFIVVYVAALVVIAIFIRLLNLKYVRVIIGKF